MSASKNPSLGYHHRQLHRYITMGFARSCGLEMESTPKLGRCFHLKSVLWTLEAQLLLPLKTAASYIPARPRIVSIPGVLGLFDVWNLSGLFIVYRLLHVHIIIIASSSNN